MTTTPTGTRATTWRLPVLMYHSVSAQPGAVPPVRLREQLGALVADGWKLVGLTEALAILARDPARRVVAVTVDDGLLDFLTALEVLHDLGARATLYVPTGLVGRPATLGWATLAGLPAAGVEIGSHTCHHRPLDVLPAATVAAELTDSKRALEDRIGVAVASFCYPHGYTSRRVTAAVATAGYENACVVGRRIARSTDDRFTIPRVEARPGLTAGGIASLVEFGEPGPAPVAKRIAMPAWRLARRAVFTTLHREVT